MTKTLQELHAGLIGYLHEGKFAEGIEDFYAEDVVAREGGGPPASGRTNMAATERRFLKKVTAYHGIDVHASAIDDQGGGTGTVFYEATMKWDQVDRPETVHVQQAVIERWKDGKIHDIRFYGNFDPGELPD